MATSIETILQDAYREANLIELGGTLSENEITEGLRLLNRFVKALFGNELGVPLEPVSFGSEGVEQASPDMYYYNSVLEYFIPLNTKIMANLTEAKTLNLHPAPQDGARIGISDISSNFDARPLTLKGNGRKIEGANEVILSDPDTDIEYFYRGDIGEWKEVSNFLEDGDSPFPEEFDDLLIIGLAMRLASRYGVELANSTMMAFARVLGQFQARYRQVMPESSELGLIMLNGTGRDNIWSLNGLFESGHPIYGK